MNTPPQFTRTHILLGDEGIQKLKSKHIFIAGLGGVGRSQAGQHRAAVPQHLAVQLPRNFCYGKTHWIDLSVGTHYKALRI